VVTARGHIAGSQCFWATGGAEKASKSEAGGVKRLPPDDPTEEYALWALHGC